MKKLIAVLILMSLITLPIAYAAEELDNLELPETDLQIEGVDVDSSDVLTDNGIPMDMAELDLAIGELENTDSNEVVPSTAAPNEYGDVAIDVDHFSDANFRAYVLEKIDTNGDGYLSEAERLAVTILEICNMKISDLDGVEYFSEMKKLSCSDNFLTELDVSHNLKLEDLNCEKNRIEQLDVSKNIYLEDLICSDNNISELNVGGCRNLKALNCENNKLKKLDVSMCIPMNHLECYNNALQSLQLNMNLTYFNCSNNVLSSLDVSYNTGLKWFSCTNNNISSLRFRDCSELMYVFCSNNKLTSFIIGKCPKLERIFCNDNLLKTLDVSKCTTLNMLKCNGNKLSKLKLGKNLLSDLYCDLNKLKTVDIGGCPDLMDEVTSIISGINTKWGVIAWGSEFDDYEGREFGNTYIRIDKSTTLKNGKKILYKPGNPKSIKFTRRAGTLKEGSSVNLGKYLRMSPSGVASICKLTSSNKNVVKVDNSGYAYGLKKGTATITVKTANGKKAKIKITVK